MQPGIEFKKSKPTLLERFGTYYLSIFRSRDLSHHVFDFTDQELSQKVRSLTFRGIFWSALTGIVCVWPTVYVGVLKQNDPVMVYLLWLGIVTGIFVVIELYLLFLI